MLAPDSPFAPAAEDAELQRVFARQCEVSLLIADMAERLYNVRSKWIGGGTIPYKELDALRQHDYRREVETLVKKAPHER